MRKAVDTNVLVRAMVDEGTQECEVAMTVLATQPLAISVTVLLEAEWVLRSMYGASRVVVAGLFAKLFGADNIMIEDHDIVADALAAHSSGMDFADALHLFRAADGNDVFLSFDRPLMRITRRIPVPLPVISPV